MGVKPKGLSKRPVFFCWDGGEYGRWSHNEPATKDGCEDVVYYKRRFLVPKKCVIRNVLTAVANVPIFHTKFGDPAGYKILISGSNGNAELATNLNVFGAENIKRISEELLRAKISEKRRDVDIKKLATGEEERIKDMRRAADFLSTPVAKKEKIRRPLPGIGED